MLETPHAVVGAAIASKIPNPFIAIPLAFASHFILDMTPHWNPHLNTEIEKYGRVTKKSTRIVVVDVILALVLGFWIAYQFPSDRTATILAGAFAGVLPDLVEGPYFFLNFKNKSVKSWLKFQKSIQNDSGVRFGLLTQVVTLIAAIWWVFN